MYLGVFNDSGDSAASYLVGCDVDAQRFKTIADSITRAGTVAVFDLLGGKWVTSFNTSQTAFPSGPAPARSESSARSGSPHAAGS